MRIRMPDSSANAVVPPPTTWSRRTRTLVSLALVWHLAALVVAPLAAPPPTSQLARGIAAWFNPYLQALYLNHGYRFFAPNPGPSHLVEYELTFADGSTRSGQFPNLAEHQPRLLYHRHFMLSETIFALPTPPEFTPEEAAKRIELLAETATRLEELGTFGPAAALREEQGFLTAWSEGELRPADQQALEYDRRSRRLLLGAVAQELLAREGAVSVKLFAVEHTLPRPEDVLAGRPLNDPEFYNRRFLGEFPEEDDSLNSEENPSGAEEIAPAEVQP